MLYTPVRSDTFEQLANGYEVYQPLIEHLCAVHDWENAARLIERMLQQQSMGDARVSSVGRLQNLLAHRPNALVQLQPYLHDNNTMLEPEERNVLSLSLPQGQAAQAAQPLLSQPLLDPLSAREIEVLQLMARGDSNVEIARELVIAPATVKRHVSNILSKLQAVNRTQAVACARHLGLLH